jgi:peptidyl-prolyl cis-trans isomerase D
MTLGARHRLVKGIFRGFAPLVQRKTAAYSNRTFLSRIDNMLKLMRHGVISGFFMVFLVLAAFSLVLTDWTGSFRSGVGSTNVAEYRGGKITQMEFARLVDSQLRTERLNGAQAYQMGLIHQLITSELWQRMLFDRAAELGVMVDDAMLLEHLRTLAEGPAREQNTTPAKVIKDYIQSQGVSEAVFLTGLRQDIVNTMMRRVVSGLAVPSGAVVDAMLAADGQTRNVTYFMLRDADVAGIAPPTDEQLAAYYQKRSSEFMMPERRDIAVAVIPRTALAKGIVVSDDAVRVFYEDHRDDFTAPERRVLGVVTAPDEHTAQKVKDGISSERDAVDVAKALKMGDKIQARADMFENASGLPSFVADAFKADTGAVLGPTKSPLGWHVVQVKSITPPGQQEFTDVKQDIHKQLLDDAVADAVDTALDDLNARADAGEPLDNVVKAFGITAQSYAALTREGQGPGGKDVLKDQAVLKAAVLPAAFAATTTGAVLSPIELSTGDVAVVQVNFIVPSAPRALAEIKSQLVDDWTANERKNANMMNIQAVLPDLLAGTVTMKDMAEKQRVVLETIKGATRAQPELPAMMDRAAWARVFDADMGRPFFHAVPGGIMIARIDDVRLADARTADKADREDMIAALTRAQANEQITQFMAALTDRYNPRVNDRMIKAMFAGGAQNEMGQ